MARRIYTPNQAMSASASTLAAAFIMPWLKKSMATLAVIANLSLVTGAVNAAQVEASQRTADIEAASAVLDQLHRAATRADWDTYFGLYLPEAIFIGTDATEHWSMSEFEGYARPTKGWEYTLKTREFISVKTQNNDRVLIFDERLNSDSYGLSRGTGTLIETDSGWKIAQYHLSFPIPNEIAKDITTKIKAHS